MRECDIDWCALARDQATRKYGEPLPTVFSEKVKIQRFLLYRGYLMEDIRGYLAKFCRLNAYGILLPSQENLSYSHFSVTSPAVKTRWSWWRYFVSLISG